MRMASGARSQRGVALIMAVLIVALATMLAVSVASDGYMDQRRTSTVMLMDQAYEMGLGAEALAAETLQDDNAKTDSLNEPWATPIILPVDDGAGEIRGHLDDLQGRFNVNNLLNADGTRNEQGVRQFQRLLELLGIDIKYATITLDWIDADSNPEFPDGAEDTVYTAQTPAYLTPNMPITRTSELMSEVGMKTEDYRKLEPHIAALPIGTDLNVCTASGIVLDSLSASLVEYSRNSEALTKGRANGCFPTIMDLDRTLGQEADSLYAKIKARNSAKIAENSSYFRANILVTIGTTELALYSVLNRTGTGGKARTRVIQRSFGTT
ncbi:MAG: type II secretion system minor pseudopilin GspK [Steroidobacteraceae bacterium]